MNATVTDVKPKTTEQVRADARQRVIANAKRPAKRTSPKLSLPLPKAHTPLVRKLPTVAPAVPAEPKLTPKAVRALGFATECMDRKDWSQNQRRLAAFYHLQSDPLIANLSPDDLL